MAEARFTAGCIQLNSGDDPAANLRATAALIRRAKDQGADLVLTPEATNFMVTGRRGLMERARPEETDVCLAGLRELAAELEVWLLIGSLLLRLDRERGVNRSLLVDPGGKVVARYDKIHMFDVTVPDGQSYRESRAYRPGEAAVVADLPWGRLGLSVCYDLRFPQLYRSLAKAGASLIAVPSAFTRFTGTAHWHVLLRARAIETACYLLAPAQCGHHHGGRETYGHSLIVGPWGEVLAEASSDEPGVILAEIDLARAREAAAMVPALTHDRPFDSP